MTQTDMFGGAATRRQGPSVTYYPRLFEKLDVAKMIESVPLKRYPIQMFGNPMVRPRDEAWFHTNPKRTYRFGGGKPVVPNPWHRSAPLLALRESVQVATGEQFDSCFVNVYRSGADSIDWHADDEDWIGPVIASVSLGEPRKFTVKRKDKTGTRSSWMLGNGDLLVMHAGMQDEWVHSLRKTAKDVGVRFNATFRQTRAT